MSDILVACRHCGALKLPSEVCVCLTAGASEAAQTRVARPSRDDAVTDAGLLAALRGIPGSISRTQDAARLAIGMFAVVAFAVFAAALGAPTGPAPEPQSTPAVEGQAPPVRLVGMEDTGTATVAAFVPIRLASGETVSVPWRSEEAVGDYRTPGRLIPVSAASESDEWTDWSRADETSSSPAPTGFILFDRSGVSGLTVPSVARAGRAAVARTPAAGPKPPTTRPSARPTRAKPAPPPASGEAPAKFVDLGTLGGEGSVAYAINEAGLVIGKAQTGDGVWHAVAWEDGKARDLGSLGGESCACAVNERGDIVGYSFLSGHAGECRAVYWPKGGSLVALGRLEGLTVFSGMGIDDSGTVFGWGFGGDGSQSVAVAWKDGEPRALASEAGSAVCSATAAGRAVGYANLRQQRAAVVWGEDGEAKPVAGLAGDWSEARAANAKGDVVGVRRPKGGSARAFLVRRSGKAEQLGTLEGYALSVAQGVNDAGTVVGNAAKGKGSSRERAFIWRDGRMTDLSTLVPEGRTIEQAWSINNRNQIAATAKVGKALRACLVTLG